MAALSAKYKVVEKSAYTFKTVTGEQLVPIAEKNMLFNHEPGQNEEDYESLFYGGGYSWGNNMGAMAILAYKDGNPVAWIMLSEDPEPDNKHDKTYALLQRYTHPDHRGNDLGYTMAKKLIPLFKKKHPEFPNLRIIKDTNGRFKSLWKATK